MSHTPTPWDVLDDDVIVHGEAQLAYMAPRAFPENLVGLDGPFSRGQMKDNAEFIVRAVNAHADLLSALEEMVAKWDEVLPHIQGAESMAWIHGWRWSGPENGMKPTVDAARALLARLRSEEGDSEKGDAPLEKSCQRCSRLVTDEDYEHGPGLCSQPKASVTVSGDE